MRGHIQESRVTISYAIGKNSTEGRTHTMCIEGTQGAEGPGTGARDTGTLHGLGQPRRVAWAGVDSASELAQPIRSLPCSP